MLASSTSIDGVRSACFWRVAASFVPPGCEGSVPRVGLPQLVNIELHDGRDPCGATASLRSPRVPPKRRCEPSNDPAIRSCGVCSC